MAKWIAAGLGVLLIVTNGFWLYMAADSLVTEKYRQAEDYERDRYAEALRNLVDHYVAGTPKHEMAAILETRFPDSLVFEKDGQLHASFISFTIGPDGNIASVSGL